MMEVICGKLSAVELKEVRRNAFVCTHQEKGCVAEDDFCEILNYLVKCLPPSRNILSLASKTGGLMLFRQCRLAQAGIFDDDGDAYEAPRSTVLPRSKHARNQVFVFVDSRGTHAIRAHTGEKQELYLGQHHTGNGGRKGKV